MRSRRPAPRRASCAQTGTPLKTVAQQGLSLKTQVHQVLTYPPPVPVRPHNGRKNRRPTSTALVTRRDSGAWSLRQQMAIVTRLHRATDPVPRRPRMARALGGPKLPTHCRRLHPHTRTGPRDSQTRTQYRRTSGREAPTLRSLSFPLSLSLSLWSALGYALLLHLTTDSPALSTARRTPHILQNHAQAALLAAPPSASN